MNFLSFSLVFGRVFVASLALKVCHKQLHAITENAKAMSESQCLLS